MARKLPKVVNKKGVEDMLRQINTRCPTGCRNYAIVMIMYRAGLRVQEVCNLTLADINTETGSIYIVTTEAMRKCYDFIGDKPVVYIQPSIDIDTPDDFEAIAKILKEREDKKD